MRRREWDNDGWLSSFAHLSVGDFRLICAPGRNDAINRLNDIVVSETGAVIPLISRGNVSAFGNDIANTGPLNGWDSEYWNIEEWTREG